ncbi:MAG: hypothetical protein IPP22_05845 [Nitrosomonas sp.]|nr:hypothetical protein [Nitrosomonas sp.]
MTRPQAGVQVANKELEHDIKPLNLPSTGVQVIETAKGRLLRSFHIGRGLSLTFHLLSSTFIFMKAMSSLVGGHVIQ